MSQGFITIALDGTTRRIRFNNRARYKMSSLDRPYDLRDISKSKKSFGAIAAWVWACLYEAHPYETPEDLADVLPSDNAKLDAIILGLLEAVKMGLPSSDAAKNESAEKSPTPGQSSA